MKTKFLKPILPMLLALMSLAVLGQNAKVDHSPWTRLLETHVNEKGQVDYQGMLNARQKLTDYLDMLATKAPEKSWDESEKLAFWINAYNAFTVQLILDHYPLKSIMDIDKAWDQKFIRLGNTSYSLNEIEHEIIRKEFNEPRIHFALVCAAVSCPVLLNKAYEPASLNKQFDEQAMRFITDRDKNRISTEKLQLSQLFNWFKDDFTKSGTLINYLNRYSGTQISETAKIDYLEYNWGLNGK